MTEQAQYISGRTVQEQMDNLIKYVDDRSKTVAEEEAQRVLVPAENAKVAAEAAADRVVSSVGQFESRLGGVEDGVAGNRSSIQTIDGEITDIYNDLTNCVRKVGEAGQVVMNGLDLRGTNRASNTTVGQYDNQIANGKRVIDELAAYAPMVRTTGNQFISGFKMLGISPARTAGFNPNTQEITGVSSASVGYAITTAYLRGEATTDYKYYDLIRVQDTTGKTLFNLRFSIGPNLQRLEAVINKKDGSSQTIIIATVND